MIIICYIIDYIDEKNCHYLTEHKYDINQYYLNKLHKEKFSSKLKFLQLYIYFIKVK